MPLCSGCRRRTWNVSFSLASAGDTMDGREFISDSWPQASAYYAGSTWNDETGPKVIAPTAEPGSSFTQVDALDSKGAAPTIG